MSFLKKLKNRDADSIEHKPTEGGIPSNGGKHKDKSVSYRFETTYVQESRYENGKDELIENEERIITDRKHSEKALQKVFKKHVTFKDYIQALIWRIKND